MHSAPAARINFAEKQSHGSDSSGDEEVLSPEAGLKNGERPFYTRTTFAPKTTPQVEVEALKKELFSGARALTSGASQQFAPLHRSTRVIIDRSLP